MGLALTCHLFDQAEVMLSCVCNVLLASSGSQLDVRNAVSSQFVEDLDDCAVPIDRITYIIFLCSSTYNDRTGNNTVLLITFK